MLELLIFVGILALAVVGYFVAVKHEARINAQRDQRLSRLSLEQTDERIPLVESRPARAAPPWRPDEEPPHADSAPLFENGASPSISESELFPPPVSTPRIVDTPTGPMLLTSPPFRARPALFSIARSAYVSDLRNLLPPWLALCPKVRLDSLLVPTSPDGRDADDWRRWRRRVRLRAVDLLLCDARTWRPVLAILIEDKPVSGLKLGGGRDRIFDEVFRAASIPFVRTTGKLADDWPLIRPYLDDGLAPRDAADPAWEGPQPLAEQAAVNLLRLDDENGWLLE